jgi:hypothetical protein
MTSIFRPGDEYTPAVAAAFAALLAAITENQRTAGGPGVVAREGDDEDLIALLSLDTQLPIEIAAAR